MEGGQISSLRAGRSPGLDSNPPGRIGRTLSMFSRRRKSRIPSCGQGIFVLTVFQYIETIWNNYPSFAERANEDMPDPTGPK